ncbi:hypothetical protein B0H10DRAFT_2221150 [Mycena sp. CBHHK59/15]|nr:hypothetical protein B0H10DRAFT_2221150 [Mycena sp. CBHHK59/15]
MPLFGSSKHENKLEKPHRTAEPQLQSTGYGAGTGAGMDRNNEMHSTTGPHTGTVGMGEPGMGNPSMGNPATMGGGRHTGAAGAPQGHMGMRNDGMTADQYGAGGAGAGIPPAETINDTNQSRTSGGGAMMGKIEHALGSFVGSNALKAKGMQKEREAHGLIIQSQELAEAERLEHEAGLRRQRAVAHGAHPDNRHLGGVPGQGGASGPYS